MPHSRHSTWNSHSAGRIGQEQLGCERARRRRRQHCRSRNRQRVQTLCRSTDGRALIDSVENRSAWLMAGHSRLETHGFSARGENNQPVVVGEWTVLHNGIITNETASLGSSIDDLATAESDTAVIAALFDAWDRNGRSEPIETVLGRLEGEYSIIALSTRGDVVASSNVGTFIDSMTVTPCCWSTSLANFQEGVQSRRLGYRWARSSHFASETVSYVQSCKERQACSSTVRWRNGTAGNQRFLWSSGAHRGSERTGTYLSAALRRCTRCILPRHSRASTRRGRRCKNVSRSRHPRIPVSMRSNGIFVLRVPMAARSSCVSVVAVTAATSFTSSWRWVLNLSPTPTTGEWSPLPRVNMARMWSTRC